MSTIGDVKDAAELGKELVEGIGDIFGAVFGSEEHHSLRESEEVWGSSDKPSHLGIPGVGPEVEKFVSNIKDEPDDVVVEMINECSLDLSYLLEEATRRDIHCYNEEGIGPVLGEEVRFTNIEKVIVFKGK